MPDAQRCELGGIPDKLVGRETGGLPSVNPKVGIAAGELCKKKKKKKIILSSTITLIQSEYIVFYISLILTVYN